ncbi:hypothetical protein NQZ68_033329 [Dissostichus eleginoides]|nr:hypothetical protein NQZ68_033329 [Dissostichus eleginoides]
MGFGPQCFDEGRGHCTSENFREIIGTFSQVITIQRELGSKRGRPGSRAERPRLPSVIFPDKTAPPARLPEGPHRPILYLTVPGCHQEGKKN